jgi:hypothetical protein
MFVFKEHLLLQMYFLDHHLTDFKAFPASGEGLAHITLVYCYFKKVAI